MGPGTDVQFGILLTPRQTGAFGHHDLLCTIGAVRNGTKIKYGPLSVALVQPDMDSVSKTVQLDVVELLKQVLQWTPLYKPGLNRALIQAAKVGSIGCIKVLISSGADIDTEDENGDTPFVHAFRGKHMDIMQTLRDAGCQTEIVKMSLALATKDIEFIKFCHQLDIQTENEDWNTADAEEICILLEELQIDPFVGQYGSHGYDDSPFMFLAQEGKPEILTLIMEKHPTVGKYTEDDKQDKMNRALHKAIRQHHLDNTKLFLEELGAQINGKDAQGRTPFLAACEYDDKIADYLMSKDADVTIQDNEGLTALHWAACVGAQELCQKLMEKGCEVDARAKLGATPLMVACSGGHLEIVQYLIECGSDVTLSTPEGWTAMHVAVWANASNVVQALLAANANPDVQSNQLTHNSDIVPASTPLLIAICLGSTKLVRHLLDANCDINLAGLVCKDSTPDDEVSTETQSPVLYALQTGGWEIAELLVRLGCDLQPILNWQEDKKLLEIIPEDKQKMLKKLVESVTCGPVPLKDLTRRFIRRLLGRDFLTKMEALNLNLQTQSSLLLHDLYKPPPGENSFEV